jgi:peroxiredoxin
MKINIKKASLIICLLILNLFEINAQIAKNPEDISPLLIGEKIPKAILKDEKGNSILLNDLLKEKPTVLVFYRGGWCPYCNLQLSALAFIEDEILKLGYQIIAISPENFKNIQPTIEEDKVNYKIVSDEDGKLIQEIGIAFKPNLITKTYIATKTNGKSSSVLPVPTVMVVNKNSEILFEYINPNYKNRITPELLLAVLKNLNIKD